MDESILQGVDEKVSRNLCGLRSAESLKVRGRPWRLTHGLGFAGEESRSSVIFRSPFIFSVAFRVLHRPLAVVPIQKSAPGRAPLLSNRREFGSKYVALMREYTASLGSWVTRLLFEGMRQRAAQLLL